MQNIYKRMKDYRKNKYKEESKGMDAAPLIKALMNKKFTKEEVKEFGKILHDGAKEAGERFLTRAFNEGDIKKKEWKEMKKKYGFVVSDMATVLHAFFGNKDGHFPKENLAVIISTGETKIYEHRKFLLKKFNVKVVNPIQGMKMMMKEDVESLKDNKKKAIKFNEGYLKSLSDKQKKEMLKVKALKKCKKCKYLMFQAFAKCPKCGGKQ